MKTKINSFVAIVLIAIMAMSFINKANANTSILIQSDDKNVSTVMLSQSANIISKRLKDYSSDKFELTVFPEKNQIMVALSENWDVKVAEKLLTQKGKTEFYKTYNRTGLSELSIDSKHLLSLLKNDVTGNTDAKIGSCTEFDTFKVNDYLKSLEKNLQCKFVWGQPSESGEVSLYALRLEKDNRSLLTGTDIESMKSGKDGKINFVELSFKKPAIELWANITRQNINQSIAIVMDDTVLCTPVVRSAIENGKAMITGSFTEAETKLIAALGSNGELSITFHIVK
jgi:preprotein translocase subunit SecD